MLHYLFSFSSSELQCFKLKISFCWLWNFPRIQTSLFLSSESLNTAYSDEELNALSQASCKEMQCLHLPLILNQLQTGGCVNKPCWKVKFQAGGWGLLNYRKDATNGSLIRLDNVLLLCFERPEFGGQSRSIPIIVVPFHLENWRQECGPWCGRVTDRRCQPKVEGAAESERRRGREGKWARF